MEGPSSSSIVESPFTHETVPLLSALSHKVLGDHPVADQEKLKFLMKVNQALISEKISEDFGVKIKEEWALYKPLVVVGPSGAGKVDISCLTYTGDIDWEVDSKVPRKLRV